jgi:hypothetical protein
MNKMTSRNYINGIPESVIGYGKGRNQFETYDGLYTNNSTTIQQRIANLESEIKKRQVWLTNVESLLNGLGTGKTLRVSKITSNVLVNATFATITNQTDTICTISNNVHMEGKPIYLAEKDNYQTKIQAISADIVGHPTESFTDVRGQRGGALSSGPSRTVCLDFCGGRIRSPKTFQSGKGDYVATSGTIYFQSPFSVTPAVIANHEIATSVYHFVNTYTLEEVYFDCSYYVKITDVYTDKFDYQLMTHLSKEVPLTLMVRSQPFTAEGDLLAYNGEGPVYSFILNWMAFDPTDTNIFA